MFFCSPGRVNLRKQFERGKWRGTLTPLSLCEQHSIRRRITRRGKDIVNEINDIIKILEETCSQSPQNSVGDTVNGHSSQSKESPERRLWGMFKKRLTEKNISFAITIRCSNCNFLITWKFQRSIAFLSRFHHNHYSRSRRFISSSVTYSCFLLHRLNSFREFPAEMVFPHSLRWWWKTETEIKKKKKKKSMMISDTIKSMNMAEEEEKNNVRSEKYLN